MHPTDEPQPATPDQPTNPDEQPLPIDPEANELENEVDQASDDSFPASDPPSYSGTTTTRD